MNRLFTILIVGASLALVSCATPKKDCATCDSKAKSDCCSKGAAAKTDCATCDSKKKH
jgi:hypothetical protein